MATKFVFEDSSSVPISMLLSKAYNGNNIFFSSGCDRLLSKAVSVQEENDIIVIYYDVAPNNRKTVKGYSDICTAIHTYGIKNIMVVPIICIEYIVVKMLAKYQQLIIPSRFKKEQEFLIDRLDWDSYIKECNTSKYTEESIEHFYKYVLSQIQPQICKRNKHKYINNENIDWNSGSGKYFYKKCPCDRFCKVCDEADIKLKAERLYMELPLPTIINDAHKQYMESLGFILKEKSVADVEREIIHFYDEICNNMNVNGISIKFA